MDHPWDKTLNRIITLLFSLLLFFVPLIFWPSNSELFEFNKMILTYFITGTITTLWLTQATINKKISLQRTPLDLPIILFLTGQIITTIFSINPHTSIWGYYSRFHGGLASTISYLTLYYIFVSHFTKKENHHHLKFVLYSILSSAALISIYGILEHFGIDKDIWVQDVQNRVFSTLGQPNWLSAYLVAILPLPIYLALSSKNLKPKIYHLTFATLYLATIFFTKSRSGIATTGIVLGLIALQQLSAKIKYSYLLIIPIILTALYLKPSFIRQISPFGNNNLNELVQNDVLSRNGGSDSMAIRQVVWQGAIDLFKQRPFLGSGLETFGYSYYWTRPASHNLLSEWDFLYNKAHNEYLNLLATTGLIGFSTYIILISSILLLLIKNLRQNQTTVPKHALFIGYISILITNYFGFSVVPVALFFFLYPAFSLAASDSSLPLLNIDFNQPLNKKHTPPPLTFLQYLIIITFFITLSFWTIFLGKHWVADIKYAKGKTYNQNGYISQALPLLESAVSLYPNEPNFRSQLAEGYANAALATKQQLDSLTASQAAQLGPIGQKQLDQYIDLALQQTNLTLEQNPWHLNFYKSKAKIYLTLAQIDPQYQEHALNTLLKANELAPTDAKIVYNIGLLHLQLNNQDQAEIAFRQAINLKENYDGALIELIKILTTKKETDEIKFFAKKLQLYYPNHPYLDLLPKYLQ